MKKKHSKLFAFAKTTIALVFVVLFTMFTACSGSNNEKVQTQQAAKPVATPGPGQVSPGTSVTLSTTTEGAAICYTTNGDTPTASSNVFSESKPIIVNTTMTIKAIAVSANLDDSEMLEAKYTVVTQAAMPTASPSPGEVDKDTPVTLSTLTQEAVIHYTTNGDIPTESSSVFTDPILITEDMIIKAVAVLEGMTDSEMLEAEYTVAPPGTVAKPTADPAAGAVDKNTPVTLSTTTIGAFIYYTVNGDTPTESSDLFVYPILIDQDMTIKAFAVKDGMTDSSMLEAEYTVKDQVETPTASPAAGVVDKNTPVTLSTATPGAVIYYTVNGDTPTGDSTEFTTPIIIDENMTVKAVAILEGYTDSEILEAVYTVKSQVAVPTASPSAGEVELGTLVTLSTTTSGAAIHYTTDGQTPTASSPEYTAQIEIDQEMTIKAFAILAGYTDSEILEAEYTVRAANQLAKPEADPAAGPITYGDIVTLSTASSGADIYYTTDGNDPTDGDTHYTVPIQVTGTLNGTFTIKAIAILSGSTDSEILTVTFTIQPIGQVTLQASPTGGEVAENSTVALSAVPIDAVIHYTTNGSTPTTGSSVYSTPIVIDAGMTIKAIAVKTGYTDSSVLEETYTIASAPGGYDWNRENYEILNIPITFGEPSGNLMTNQDAFNYYDWGNIPEEKRDDTMVHFFIQLPGGVNPEDNMFFISWSTPVSVQASELAQQSALGQEWVDRNIKHCGIWEAPWGGVVVSSEESEASRVYVTSQDLEAPVYVFSISLTEFHEHFIQHWDENLPWIWYIAIIFDLNVTVNSPILAVEAWIPND